MLTIYSSDNAIVLQKNPPVYSLPSQNSQTSNIDLTSGEQVKIMESSGDWTRIRTTNNSEGWISSTLIEQLWPE
jgi:SH3-like domain-containing protein